ncbi:MAG: exodeoxyribonuclease VII large subunit [Sciscionella sp.]|nr:exodeoxyribonuclease VII large subunit [Sciscionella sp.]
MSEPSTAQRPWPVRTVARKIADWIHRLGEVWVEGQLTQISARPGTSTAFLTLRDPAADISLTLTCSTALLRNDDALADGSRVVVHGRPYFYAGRGTLSLRVDEIRQVGLGELLARIERLRKQLAADGLFNPARKRPLPLLPKRIGLITGRASAAEHDVLSNAIARWPAAAFEVRNVAVQGATAVPQIIRALSTLDADPDVEVIVIARGGGSVEDLLPFSDERLCRVVADCRTPVVSAIGHEPDAPLLDHVADLRCSTPTDAGKRIVPDIAEQSRAIAALRERARRALSGWVDQQQRLLTALRSRPVLADPRAGIDARGEHVDALRERGRRAVLAELSVEHTRLQAMRARLTTLGPAATLARGYAVAQWVDESGQSHLVHSIEQLRAGTELRIRLVDGAVIAVVSTVI